MRILVFGDSIAYGAWDSAGGWVERVKRYAHTRTIDSEGEEKIQVLNLGIGSDTSTKLLRRMSAEIEARRSASWPFLFIVAIGTNDERTIDGQPETPLETYVQNIRDIITTAQHSGGSIVFLGIPPLSKPIMEFKGQEYSDARIRAYDEALRDVTAEMQVDYLPIRLLFEHRSPDALFSYDELHPNDAGHRLIADAVTAYLDGLLTAGKAA